MVKDNKNLTSLIQQREILGGGSFGGHPAKSIIKSSTSWISKLKKKVELKEHHGCVNTINWNEGGTLIITGSDDCKLDIWHGDTFSIKKVIKTGHCRNIFSAQFVPGNDNQVISCGMDGEIRYIDYGGPTQADTCMLSSTGMIYKLNFIPGSQSVFVSTQQDGFVNLFDIRAKADGKIRSLIEGRRATGGGRDYGVNSLAFSPVNGTTFALGGADPVIRLLDIRMTHVAKSDDDYLARFCPATLLSKQAQSRSDPFSDGAYVTGVDFSIYGEIGATYSRDSVYVFDSNAHPSDDDVQNNGGVVTTYKNKYLGARNVRTFLKEVAFLGNDNFIATGSDCGHLFIWDKETAQLVQMLKADNHVVNGVAPHPFSTVVATCGIDKEGKIFDIGGEVTFKPEKAKTVMETNEKDEPPVNMMALLCDWLARMREERARNQGAGTPTPAFFDDDEDMLDEEDLSPEAELRRKLSDADDLRAQGNALWRRSQWRRAIEQYDAALEVLNFTEGDEDVQQERKRSRIVCLLNRAACLLKLDRFSEVVDECTQILVDDPESMKALYRRAQAHFHLQKYAEALADAEKAIQVDPSAEEVHSLINQIKTASSSSSTSSTTSSGSSSASSEKPADKSS